MNHTSQKEINHFSRTNESLNITWSLLLVFRSETIWKQVPVLTTSLIFRHLISGSLALVSMIHTWPSLMPGLFLNAYHHGSLPQQLKVVWSLLLQAGSEGPTLIFHAAWLLLAVNASACLRGTLVPDYILAADSADLKQCLGKPLVWINCLKN